MKFWGKVNKRALLGTLVSVVIAIAISYFAIRFGAYYKSSHQWDANWHTAFEPGPERDHYIAVMTNAGIDPFDTIPARPTYWSTELVFGDYLAMAYLTLWSVLSGLLVRTAAKYTAALA